MTEYHHEARAESRSRKFDTADLRGRDDVAGHADDEQVAESLVEDDLRRHPCIRAAEHDGERLLCGGGGQLTAPNARRAPLELGPALEPKLADEAPVALAQRRQCGLRRNHRHGEPL